MISLKPIPGLDKYRAPEPERKLTWADQMVAKANEEVRIEDLLNDHWGIFVPRDAQSWKAYCPLGYEHRDGGLEKNFRVYSESNSCNCFALHGFMSPVMLWRTRVGGSFKDAALSLLTEYEIEFRTLSYQERFETLQEVSEEKKIDPEPLVQALKIFLRSHPNYDVRQYDEDVLRVVNLLIGEAQELCSRSTIRKEEVELWYEAARSRLSRLLGSR